MHRCVRKSNPHNAAAISVATLLALAAFAGVGCRQRLGAPHPAPTGNADGVADSLLAATLPQRPWSMAGRATFDVEQYRVRGRFRLDVGAEGEFLLEFSGTTLFGGQREDIVVTMARDTLRVFDREHARLYEGADVDELIRQGTGTAGAWARGVARAAGISAGGGVAHVRRPAGGDLWLARRAAAGDRRDTPGSRLADPSGWIRLRYYVAICYEFAPDREPATRAASIS